MTAHSPAIKDVLGFALPDYASNTHFAVERGMGLLAYFKCELPSERLDAFLAMSDRLPNEVQQTEVPIRFATYNRQSTWWTPNDLKAPAYGTKSGQRGKWRTESHVLTENRGDRAILYFMYFEEP